MNKFKCTEGEALMQNARSHFYFEDSVIYHAYVDNRWCFGINLFAKNIIQLLDFLHF